MPAVTRNQFSTPKELSKIHHQTTTATTSGTAQGSATRSRASRLPLKGSLRSSAVPRPMTKQATETVVTRRTVTQALLQNSGEVKRRR